MNCLHCKNVKWRHPCALSYRKFRMDFQARIQKERKGGALKIEKNITENFAN